MVTSQHHFTSYQLMANIKVSAGMTKYRFDLPLFQATNPFIVLLECPPHELSIR